MTVETDCSLFDPGRGKEAETAIMRGRFTRNLERVVAIPNALAFLGVLEE